MPEGILSRCLWFWSLPIAVAFYVTIPDCRKDRWQRYYPLTFILALLWIAFLTYVLVWMVTVIGRYTDGCIQLVSQALSKATSITNQTSFSVYEENTQVAGVRLLSGGGGDH